MQYEKSAGRAIVLDPAQEEQTFQRAIKRNPEDANAHYWLGCILKSKGDQGAEQSFRIAEEIHRRVIELDPRAVFAHAGLGNTKFTRMRRRRMR